MKLEQFLGLKKTIEEAGYGPEIEWAQKLRPCPDADQFVREYIWVVLCAGMKEQVARKIESAIWNAFNSGIPIESVFHHQAKLHAIRLALGSGITIFSEYQAAEDQLEYLDTLPFIGPVTKYHLAKNLGIDCCKPDRHLVRIAGLFATTPQELCQRLSRESGLRITAVDQILWRAANLGHI